MQQYDNLGQPNFSLKDLENVIVSGHNLTQNVYKIALKLVWRVLIDHMMGGRISITFKISCDLA